jgi:predicted nucleotidyltransferase
MDFEPHLRGLRERRARAEEADRQAALEAQGLARRLARILRERYGVRRVILTGSLARGTFRRGSDIDLAVEGLADDVFFRAGAELQREAGAIDVDLVPLESANPVFRELAEREGNATA